ncbi:MAG: PKD domain-containing protein, partial [Caldilineaceae bacterium]|nr:PKD domain-containing protein [Caldilineaceae bacterium]
LQPSPPVEGRSIVFIKGIDSIGDCGNAEQWVADYFNSEEGKSLFGRAKISKYLNFNYAGGGAYSCPRAELAYREADTCDGVANAASELQALIDEQATTDKATIVAHSMGGLVTAYLVATQSAWAQAHIASVITFDSPLRGIREVTTWSKRVFSHCKFEPDAITGQSSLDDLADIHDVVQTAASAATVVPFYPLDGTGLDYVTVQIVPRSRTRLSKSRAFQIAQSCGGPFAPAEPDCQPPLSFADNHAQIWNRQSDGDGRDKALFVGCAVINALDCTFLQARVTPTNDVHSALATNQLAVEVDAGTNRMRFTSFYGGTVRMALTDPSGNHFGPDGAGTIAGYAVDDVSEVYELTDLVSGTWTIDLAAVDVPAGGVDVSVATAVIDREPSTVNAMPIADAGGAYRADIGETVTFNGIESFDADGSIVLYEWDFDSDGTIDFSSTESYAFYTYPGEFIGSVTLQVTDNEGATASGTSAVQVQRVIYMPLINR